MSFRRPLLRAALASAALAVALAAGCRPAPEPGLLRIGHFPNVTHAHGLVAHAMSREGKGWFEERLPPGTRVEWFVYNAGPSAVEAIVVGALDFVYVGPSPALNAHVRSAGTEIRVLAGATRGGSALVVPGDGRLSKPEEFRGKRVATPQLGNTQDVSCRAWLQGHGYEVTPTGGDVLVVPTANPDQLALFARGQLDAVWTVEPWVSRLETEAGGKVLVEEKDSLTTVLVGSAEYLAREPAVAAAFVRAHRELTAWLDAHPAAAKEKMRAELKDITQRDMKPELLERCWTRMRFDDAVAKGDFDSFVVMARKAGLMDEAPDLSRLVAETPR
jgi:NitT/TauT family transport system substrate-binding protein